MTLSPWLVGLIVWALLAKLLAGVMVGLWWGERGRRLAAERMLVSGSPGTPLAFRIADQPDAESRAMHAGRAAADREFSESTLDRGMKQLMREAEELGRPISVEAARKQVEAMLYGMADQETDLAELGL